MRNCTIEEGVNDRNLELISELINTLDYILFYGTLLGVTRSGVTIPGDDDIDIIMKIEDRDKVISLIISAGFPVELNSWPNNISECFLQCKLKNEFGVGFVDFYFVSELGSHMIDSWSFWGMPANPLCYIKIDRKWLIDVDLLPFGGSKIKVPKERKHVLEYLYGSSWSQPLKKGDLYLTIPFRGRPYHFFGYKKLIAITYMKILRLVSGWF